MLHVDGLSVSRAGFSVLNGVTLTVESGSIYAVLGRNGAGKTTLVEAIMGLVPVQSGEIKVDGSSILGLTPDQLVGRGVAIVPEGRKLFPNLTVREHLAIGCRQPRWFWGGPPDSVLETIWSIFPALRPFKNSLVAGLSGGQRQMVALGRALISQPKILLLDEPSFGLSPQMVEVTIQQVQRVAASGMAVVLVEQAVDLVLEIASRAALLSNGKLVAEGPPHELLATAQAVEVLFGSVQTGE